MSKDKENKGRPLAIILKIIWIAVLAVAIAVLVKSCVQCGYRAAVHEKTGYLPSYDDWDNIPDIVPPYDDNDTSGLPDKVSLEFLFPPIGDQGNKGTCVAWASGYNLKTALNALQHGWDSTALADTRNQTSPKDLWLNIPQFQKGSDCSGTGFSAAFNILASKGATNMNNAPYTNLGNCRGVGVGDSSNRIASYGYVTSGGSIPTQNQLKKYLADTVPLVIGAHLGDKFMNWDDDKVIDNDTYRRTGMHSYHAMVLVGYDDIRHAFRLRNSWGTQWGDNGSIWVDYDFFCQQMCFAVFQAEN